MKIKQEIEKLIVDNLRKTLPRAVKEGVSKSDLLDEKPSIMGFKRIFRKGYTP